MWKVYADGTLIDIVYASTAEEAIEQAKQKHGNADHWCAKSY